MPDLFNLLEGALGVVAVMLLPLIAMLVLLLQLRESCLGVV